MSQNRLTSKLGRPRCAGVYRLPQGGAHDLHTAAIANGFAYWHADLQGIQGKDALLQALAQALRFPDWFGNNWDALEDCLTDLAWCPAKGYVLVLSNCGDLAAASRETLELALNILSDAAAYWCKEGIAFWTFVDATAPFELDDLP